ncbi:hypothetical protein H4R18_000254 [Coemansia javaensis]|uniref:Uncharacterized protein n=1 Tax=Coemansia javaensis TaxID=2761396 RepID=A0A9W8HN74_9FUNG|nr:hypothetical protein H4R18_000254 [Coemansia javaensis]
MRFGLGIALLAAALASAAPVVVRRDMDGARTTLKAIESSPDDATLVVNTTTFFAQLDGIADSGEVDRSVKQVNDQIAANHNNHVPTKETAAWVSSVLAHYVTA